ncbi:MAG: TetR/AcrR family transcriptional regulator [Bacilli bacterium]|nr:TetR/AcrR family transcriptional regulator [Bacilli bacterium]
MPTVTFTKLNKEKRNNIIEASLKEFSRVPLKDASINKIIKQAGISRGSFYNYFTDINDLYLYILNRYKEKMFNIVEETLNNTNGDLVKSTIIVFEKIIDFSISNSLIKNIFLNINYSIGIENEMIKNEVDYRLVEIISKINQKKLKTNSLEELFYIIDIIISIIIHNLKDIFVDNKPPQVISYKLKKQLQILEVGIKKEET